VKSEADIERECITYLEAYGCAIVKTHDAKHRPVLPGTWDAVGSLPDGRFFAIEFKRPGEKLSVEQVDWEYRLPRAALRLIASSLEHVMAWYATVRKWEGK
jgi:hypothetical protein